MSNCKIFRNNDGSINRVFDELGNESQLYYDTLFHVSTLVDKLPITPPIKSYLETGKIKDTSIPEVALGLWAYSYSDNFRNKYDIKVSKLEEVSVDDIIRHIEEYYPKPVVQETIKVEQPVIKEGVEELFNTNPELANQVYESLGFVTPLKALESNFEKVKERLNDFNNVFAENLGNSGLPFDYFNEVELNIDDLDLSVKNKEMFDVLYQKNKASDYLKSELTSIDKQKNPILINNKGQVVEGWHRINSLKANGVKTVKAYIPITPQQKQQALQLYSQYLSNFVNTNFDSIISDLQSKNLLEKKCS